MSDTLQLFVGALVLYGPGLLLLLVCRVRSARVLVGVAPVATLGVLQLAALLTGVTPLVLPWAAVLLVSVLAVLLVVLDLRARRSGALVGVAVGTATAVRRRPWAAVVSTAVLGLAASLGITTWHRGIGPLATPPQEHDTVSHSLITAFIFRTGHASPFDVMPVDLASGDHVRYYPAAVHTFAALLTHLTDDPVSGLNAATTLLIGLAGPTTLFAAVATIERSRTRPLFGALAALLSVTLYRPYPQLAHDAGILAFAIGLALVPALVTCLLSLRRRDPGMAVATAVAALALFATHPSIAIIAVIVTAVVAVVLLPTSAARAWLRVRGRTLGLMAVLAVLLAAPWATASVTVAGSVAGYPEKPPSVPLWDATTWVTGFFYGGFLDSHSQHFQTGFAVVFWIGALGCLTSRRLWPVVAAWLAWGVAAVLYASGWADAPVLRQVGQIFFNSWVRIDSVNVLIAPAVAALGLSSLSVRLVDRWNARSDAAGRAERLPTRAVVPALVAALVALLFLSVSGLDYRKTNIHALSERYVDPLFYRITPDEREAFTFLAGQPGVGRVLNNANDGSTFLYVYEGIPVVNTYPLGMPEARHGIYLMEHFNEIATNGEVRCLVQRWDITHVVVSLTSPAIGARGAPDRWVHTKLFDYAPGFLGLVDVPEVHVVYANDDVAVFSIDPAVRQGNDLTACSVDPAHPGPEGDDG